MGEARFYLDAFPTWLVLSCSLDYYCDFEPYYDSYATLLIKDVVC